MRRKLPRSLNDVVLSPLWKYSRRFTACPLRILPTTGASTHFSGGPTVHKGGRCPQCLKKLTLFWDIDLNDVLIPDFVRKGFAPATRLPFYHCLQCLGVSYSISSDTHMRCFPVDDFLREDESPFEHAPAELARRSLSMERIPTTVEALLSLADVVGVDGFDEQAQAILRKYLKKHIRQGKLWRSDLHISQFGGQPTEYQGHSYPICPNPKCPAQAATRVYSYQEKYLMREMAVIDWRDEPVLAEDCLLLVYYVCSICFSIRGRYSCT